MFSGKCLILYTVTSGIGVTTHKSIINIMLENSARVCFLILTD